MTYNVCRLSKTSLVCCPRWCQFIFSPLTGINIIKGRGVWMSAYHLPVERQQHVWYADHLSLADVHHLLILPPWRRLTSNESAGSQRTKGQIVCFLREAIIRCLLDSDLFDILSGDANKEIYHEVSKKCNFYSSGLWITTNHPYFRNRVQPPLCRWNKPHIRCS